MLYQVIEKKRRGESEVLWRTREGNSPAGEGLLLRKSRRKAREEEKERPRDLWNMIGQGCTPEDSRKDEEMEVQASFFCESFKYPPSGNEGTPQMV